MVKDLPCNAGDMGSIPGCSIGELRSHMPHGKKSKHNRNYTAISIKTNTDPHKNFKFPIKTISSNSVLNTKLGNMIL